MLESQNHQKRSFPNNYGSQRLTQKKFEVNRSSRNFHIKNDPTPTDPKTRNRKESNPIFKTEILDLELKMVFYEPKTMPKVPRTIVLHFKTTVFSLNSS